MTQDTCYSNIKLVLFGILAQYWPNLGQVGQYWQEFPILRLHWRNIGQYGQYCAYIGTLILCQYWQCHIVPILNYNGQYCTYCANIVQYYIYNYFINVKTIYKNTKILAHIPTNPVHN